MSDLNDGQASLSVVYRLKRADWDRDYDFEFEDMAEFSELPALTIVSADVPDVSGLTLGTPVISGTRVQLEISGGTVGEFYLLDCEVTLSNGRKLSWQGGLSVVA